MIKIRTKIILGLLIIVLLAPTADARPFPPVLLSTDKHSLSGTELPCRPATFTLSMTNTTTEPRYADTMISAEQPIKLSDEIFSSYLPAKNPNQLVSRTVNVTVPHGTKPGTYDITATSGGQQVVVPLKVNALPKPEPGDDLALGQQATASSNHLGFPPCAAVDGDDDPADWSTKPGWSDGTEDAFPDWLAVHWPEPVRLRRVVVVTYVKAGTTGVQSIRDFRVQLRTGSTWKTVCRYADNTDATVTCRFPATTTSSVRVAVTDTNNSAYSRIMELEAYAK